MRCSTAKQKENLQLVIGKPVHLCEIDTAQWYYELPEDTKLEDVFPELAKKIDALNEVIRALPPASWIPSKFAVDTSFLPKRKDDGEK